jgi:hypothetical protein
MEKKFIKYPSIEQYRNIVKHISHSASFVGIGEDGEPVYDGMRPKPVLKLTGTTKIHGSNGAVCFNAESGIWTQSRKNIITPEKDNCGFSCFVHARKVSFNNIVAEIIKDFNIDTINNIISIFGEVSGGSIQKGVGVNGLDKMFVIFDVKITSHDDEEDGFWLDLSKVCPNNRGSKINDHNIYFIDEFPTFEIKIDFNKPEAFQNKLNEITLEVEERCPVAFQLGNEGVGEGVVWKGVFNGNDFRFKVKGEKHSTSKVKKLPKVDEAKMNLVNEVVNKITPAFRMEQGIQETFDTLNGGEIDRKGMGDFIRWVIGDIVKEDLDIITDAGLDVKEVNNKVSKVVRDYFFQQEQM